MGEVEEEREEVIGCPVNQECIYWSGEERMY